MDPTGGNSQLSGPKYGRVLGFLWKQVYTSGRRARKMKPGTTRLTGAGYVQGREPTAPLPQATVFNFQHRAVIQKTNNEVWPDTAMITLLVDHVAKAQGSARCQRLQLVDHKNNDRFESCVKENKVVC